MAQATRRSAALIVVVAIICLIIGAAIGWFAKPTPKPTTTAPPTTTTKPTAPTAAPTTAKKPFEGITITVLVHSGHQAVPWYKYAKAIKERYGITLRVVESPPEEIYTKALLGIRQKPAKYDIIQFNSAFIASLAPYLLPLDNYLMQPGEGGIAWGDILPCFRKYQCMWNGHVYCITLDGDMFFLYYRADLFNNPIEQKAFKEKYGYDLAPPKTWKQFLDIAKFFTRKKGEKLCGQPLQKDFYGCAFQLKPPRVFYWYLFVYWPYIAAYTKGHPNYFDPETMKPLINTTAGVEALKVLKEALKYMPPGALSWEWDECFSAFMKEGNVAMTIHWADEGKRAPELAPLPIPNPPKPQLGVTLPPGVIGPDGKLYRYTMIDAAWVVGIAKYSQHPDAAWAVLSFMCDPEHSLERVMAPTDYMPDTGHDPYRYSHIYSWRFLHLKPWMKNMVEAYQEAAQHGFPLLKIPGSYEYLEKLATYVHQYLSGQISDAKTAMDQAAAAWISITKHFGVENQKKAYQAMWSG